MITSSPFRIFADEFLSTQSQIFSCSTVTPASLSSNSPKATEILRLRILSLETPSFLVNSRCCITSYQHGRIDNPQI
ncbi:hypothetical protein MPTK1_2g04050 [Marchantia polymorpha subsp. ruderalis]|uniref:Uncharacterized protein n=1 Tax=Marchantia polymorpha TaxID=3197 RepID=A0A2R6X7K8_MARPO|nr:hypothetical protein MARPO_0031s0061 [Marchantia polymorpha]BBN01033.1 hypothetical protein Mp_2g04050 [Marchantia polymorpha subsp. ruderalis]|eukprot:PTQ42082.1 hypothetical protein MARPO_0031s0061 [Marchantia polymorpha]